MILDQLKLAAVAGALLGSLGLAAFAGHHFGAAGVQAAWDRDKLARVSAQQHAVQERLHANTREAARQETTNITITEKKHEELAPVRERIVTQRVYVASAVCGGRPAGAAEAESTASSNGADSPGRLVRSDVERDLVALKLAVEEDLATGRACQAFLKENGFVP